MRRQQLDSTQQGKRRTKYFGCLTLLAGTLLASYLIPSSLGWPLLIAIVGFFVAIAVAKTDGPGGTILRGAAEDRIAGSCIALIVMGVELQFVDDLQAPGAVLICVGIGLVVAFVVSELGAQGDPPRRMIATSILGVALSAVLLASLGSYERDTGGYAKRYGDPVEVALPETCGVSFMMRGTPGERRSKVSCGGATWIAAGQPMRGVLLGYPEDVVVDGALVASAHAYAIGDTAFTEGRSQYGSIVLLGNIPGWLALLFPAVLLFLIATRIVRRIWQALRSRN